MAVTSYDEARKQPSGWKHILSLKWNDTEVDWEDRVVNWGNLIRKVSRGSVANISGVDDLRLSDTDRTLWGSFKGTDGTEAHWSLFEVLSSLGGPDGTFQFGSGGTAKFGLFKFGQLAFGDRITSGLLKRGRVIEFSSEENELNFSLYDEIEILNRAKFVWDYEPLLTGTLGTVNNIINGSVLIIEDASDGTVLERLRGVRPGRNQFTIKRTWDTLGKFGVIGTTAIVPGDVIKFSGSSYNATDAGTRLTDKTGFSVVSGSFYSNGFGTIVLSEPLVGVDRGDYIYLRKDLTFEGNPAEIVNAMLTGTNTNVNFPTGSINQDYYSRAKSVSYPLNFRKTIENTAEGAVLQEIKEISQLVEADYYFNKSGEFCWTPARPRIGTIDALADFYDAVEDGTGNIFQFSYREKTNSIVTDVVFRFNSQEFDPVTGVFFGQEIVRENKVTPTNYNNWRSAREVNTDWVVDENDAQVLADRFLSRHSEPTKEIEFNTSLYGLEEEPYRMLEVKHRTGSLDSGDIFTVDSVTMRLSEDLITLQLTDVNKDYFGYGWGLWMTGSTLDNKVSGTSTLGWSWPDSEGNARHGSVHAILASAADYATLVLLDTGGGKPSLSTSGVSQFIGIGEEIFKVLNGSHTTSTFTVERAVETTNLNATLSSGDGFTVWPCTPLLGSGTDAHRDFLPLGGTINNGPVGGYDRCDGTVLNINPGTYGTN